MLKVCKLTPFFRLGRHTRSDTLQRQQVLTRMKGILKGLRGEALPADANLTAEDFPSTLRMNSSEIGNNGTNPLVVLVDVNPAVVQEFE